MAKKKKPNTKACPEQGRGDKRLSTRKYVCERHPDRIAAVHHGILGLACWECLFRHRGRPDVFEKRFGPGFYEPGGPGYAE